MKTLSTMCDKATMSVEKDLRNGYYSCAILDEEQLARGLRVLQASLHPLLKCNIVTRAYTASTGVGWPIASTPCPPSDNFPGSSPHYGTQPVFFFHAHHAQCMQRRPRYRLFSSGLMVVMSPVRRSTISSDSIVPSSA